MVLVPTACGLPQGLGQGICGHALRHAKRDAGGAGLFLFDRGDCMDTVVASAEPFVFREQHDGIHLNGRTGCICLRDGAEGPGFVLESLRRLEHTVEDAVRHTTMRDCV